ncbi:MAG: hypothetical protein HY873_09920 [Chloroflexi bacterium]|nr:hypothetical protein [Chloroflexota bacterium]
MKTDRNDKSDRPSPPADVRVRPPRYQRLATVVVERPRCPACNGVRLLKYRSIADQGDGSALAWVRCLACACRFKLLME